MADPLRTVRRAIHRVREWVLLDANRFLVAGLLLVAVFAVVSIPAVTRRLAPWSSTSMFYVFSGYLTGNLTLITVVLSINQLVLSRELRTPRAMTEEITGAVEFRDAVERETEAHVTPEDLTHFLHLLLSSFRDEVRAFATSVESVADESIRREGDAFATALGDKVDELDEPLTESDIDLFTALSTILAHDLAAEFSRADWLADSHAETLDEDALTALAAVQTHVRQFETARQYVKTIYIQVELARLSRQLLYVGFVTEVLAVAALAVGSGPGPLPSGVLYRCLITVGFAPISLLFAYVLRVATVAQRTAAFVPFGTPE